jgi:hypothetical protein
VETHTEADEKRDQRDDDAGRAIALLPEVTWSEKISQETTPRPVMQAPVATPAGSSCMRGTLR